MKFTQLASVAFSLCLLVACADPEPEENVADVATGVTIALMSNTNEYVSCELNAENPNFGILRANRAEAKDWEKIEMVDLGEGKIALKAANGKFVCDVRNNGSLLIANRDGVGEWETFSLDSLGDGKYAIKASSGKYVSVEHTLPDSISNGLVANRDAVGDWEKFTLVKNPQ